MPQSRDELRGRVEAVREIFSSILNDATTYTNLGDDKQQQLITGINKAYGQAMGFLHEYTTTQAAQAKARTVTTQTFADVTVGAADLLFAKSSELKSVTKPEKGAVNKVIGDALEQLAGQTGHNPRTDDVRVVDIRISSENNPWPLSGGSYGTDRPFAQLSAIDRQAVKEIADLLSTPKPGADALRTWLLGETYDGPLPVPRLNTFGIQHPPTMLGGTPTFVHSNRNSTRPVYTGTTPGIKRVRCVTVKVRYDPGYILATPPDGHFYSLTEIVVQCYHHALHKWQVEVVKRKVTTFDVMTGAWLSEDRHM